MEEHRARQLFRRDNGLLWWSKTLWVEWYINQTDLESTLEKDQMDLYPDNVLIMLQNDWQG